MAVVRYGPVQGNALSAVASCALGLLLVYLLRPAGPSAALHASPAVAGTRLLFPTPLAAPTEAGIRDSTPSAAWTSALKSDNTADASAAPVAGLARPAAPRAAAAAPAAPAAPGWLLAPLLTLGAAMGWYSHRHSGSWAAAAGAGAGAGPIKPLNGYVVVEEFAEEAATGRGVLLMDAPKDVSTGRGRVVAVGAETDPAVTVGAAVLYPKSVGQEFKLGGKAYLAIQESYLLAVFE